MKSPVSGRVVVRAVNLEGDEQAGVERDIPQQDLSIGDMFRIFSRDRNEAARFLEVPQMSEAWKRWAQERIG